MLPPANVSSIHCLLIGSSSDRHALQVLMDIIKTSVTAPTFLLKSVFTVERNNGYLFWKSDETRVREMPNSLSLKHVVHTVTTPL